MSNPSRIVEEVSNIATDNGPGSYERAYQHLQNEYDNLLENERLCSPDQQVNQAKVAKQWEDMTDELSRRGLLAGLSVAYLRDNFDRLDTQGRKTGHLPGPDGMLTHSEIRQEQGHNKVFANYFDNNAGKKDFFFEVARATNHGNTRKVIEHEDVDRYLRREDRSNRKAERQEDARHSMDPLFQQDECDQRTLLEHINSKNRNGRVTVREMQMYLDECDRRANNPDSIYNEKNAAFVQSILNGEQTWNRAGDGFQINKLARKGNFDALNMTTSGAGQDLKDNFDAADEMYHSKTAPVAEDFTEKTTCEEVAEAEQPKDTVEPEKDCADKAEGCIEVPKNLFEVRQGEGYWHVAKRLLSLNPQDKPTNQEIMHCMTVMITQNAAHRTDVHPHYAPMLHTGDTINCDIAALCAQVPAAKRILRR